MFWSGLKAFKELFPEGGGAERDLYVSQNAEYLCLWVLKIIWDEVWVGKLEELNNAFAGLVRMAFLVAAASTGWGSSCHLLARPEEFLLSIQNTTWPHRWCCLKCRDIQKHSAVVKAVSCQWSQVLWSGKAKGFLNAWAVFLWMFCSSLLIGVGAEEMREIKEKLNIYMYTCPHAPLIEHSSTTNHQAGKVLMPLTACREEERAGFVPTPKSLCCG